ncbi:26316_t:CDS:2 [Racocetra persica]|uniref:26316_t:CDS:1 n=1 Tax=Racocetra persica TaxID=160502 RepID=A0ACA9KWA4_9GLOM|nr:26316_t:CDS:2 [Racocetra persica]
MANINAAVDILNPGNFNVTVGINPGSLIRKGVKMYIDNKSKKTCERILKAHFKKLANQGYLSVIGDDGFQLTDKALDEQIGLMAYLDIRAFMQMNNFSVEEITIVTRTRVQIWLSKKYLSWDKRVGDAWSNTADFAKSALSDVLNSWYASRSSDAKQPLNQSMGYLLNAEAALDANLHALMIATRIIGLAQMCGIPEIGLLDIIEGLSKSYIFETTGRAIVAGMRGRHSSEVYNIGLGIRGSSENVHKNFMIKAGGFKGSREVIGKYTGGKVVLNSIVAKDTAMDIHGNQLRCTNQLKVTLSIKRVAGVPLAKVKRIGSLQVADMMCGGITGTACPCTNPDQLKKLKRGGRVGKVKVIFRKIDPLNLPPAPRLTIMVHETYGDGVAHLFLSHCLKSGAYVRADGECLYCAVCRAVGIGCTSVLL